MEEEIYTAAKAVASTYVPQSADELADMLEAYSLGPTEYIELAKEIAQDMDLEWYDEYLYGLIRLKDSPYLEMSKLGVLAYNTTIKAFSDHFSNLLAQNKE